MRPLNYHHLLYFWSVARTGSVGAAARELGLTQPTLSGQIRTLERQLGLTLFDRVGRNVVPSADGQLVLRYADEIFGLGRELVDAVARRPAGPPTRFVLGVSDALPKVTAVRLLEPALRLTPPVRLVLRVDKTDRLLANLAMHAIDLVLADMPVGPTVAVRAFSHLLGECGITVFAPPEVAPRYRRTFPRSLHGAPFVLQAENTALRRSLDAWFETHGLAPAIVAEVEDIGLMQLLGSEGMGLFAAPSLVEDDIRRQYGVRIVGRLPDARERFYAISTERKPRLPATMAILNAARAELFS